MQRIFLIVFLVFTAAIASFSQTGELLVKFGSKGLFLEHKVEAKENFYSIGRLYHVHPKNLASYNGLDMAKGLSLGQSVNIPLTDTNLNRKLSGGVPVFYQPLIKQTAGSISALSKTPLENIRKWNSLTGDNIGAGSKVIIGYMVSSAEIKAVSITGTIKNDIATATPAPEKKKEAAEEKGVTVANTEKKATPKTEDTIKTAVVKEEYSKTVQQVPRAAAETTGGEEEGYFREYFTLQLKKYPLSKDETVTSGIFKTTSGWNDGKYYALIDGIEPGTIIRVVNPSNNKSVYVKVLGQISSIRQNQGLNLRISNAAATALAISEQDKFIVKVKY